MFFFVSKRSSICIIYRIIAERERDKNKKRNAGPFSSLFPYRTSFSLSIWKEASMDVYTTPIELNDDDSYNDDEVPWEERGQRNKKGRGRGALKTMCTYLFLGICSVLLVPVSIILLSSPILFYLIATVVWNIAYGREMYNVNSSRVSLPHMFFVFKKKKKERDCEEEGSKKKTPCWLWLAFFLLLILSIYSIELYFVRLIKKVCAAGVVHAAFVNTLLQYKSILIRIWLN